MGDDHCIISGVQTNEVVRWRTHVAKINHLKENISTCRKKDTKLDQKEILVAYGRHLARYAEVILKSFMSACPRVDGLSKTIKLEDSRRVGKKKKRAQAVSQIRFRCFTGWGIHMPLGHPYIWYSLTPSFLNYCKWNAASLLFVRHTST